MNAPTTPSLRERLPSLRGRLLVGSLLLIIASGLFSGYANYADSQEEVEELFDAEMAQMARTLQSIFSTYMQGSSIPGDSAPPLTYDDYADHPAYKGFKPDYDDHEVTAYGHRYEKKLAFQIWKHPDTLLIQTRSAASIHLPIQAEGFSNVVLNGEPWRVFALHDTDNDRWIQVAQRDDVRRELALEIALHAVATPMLTIPLLGVFLWLLVSASLRPLEALSSHVAKRAPFDATPLESRGALRETRPLIQALNDLFARVTAQADRERQFTADAAHELRTPLAAIKINLQNALRRTEEPRTSQSLQRSLAALDRLIELTEQMLDLNRIDTVNDANLLQPVPLGEHLQALIQEVQPVAQVHHIRLETQFGAPCVISIYPPHLHSLLLNFISNAIRYAGPETTLTLRQDGSEVDIIDEGPGIPENLRNRVFDRFFRGSGDSGEGAGLGLAIAKRIADHYGVTLSLRDRENGKSGLWVHLAFRNPDGALTPSVAHLPD